ncbi:hypothetical protein GMORB2_2142 [Geosmithia morbida]|uniref:TMEM205-like domain-containing protein n=1 Tax=Geosmithia morbida TaxID=1094350 RepID=A0A9P4YSC8_9HYPO|nr:uncharacterized protein GMORB2_2142 [Geosmithia morbida]KAF4121180.1 hypothetical protein GMORB2_2142 [Geosmithia morbida]
MAGSALFSAAPYHILSYGTLLGTSFYQSFINGPVMFRSTNRTTFSTVQSGLFPIYFGMQTFLPIIMIFTFPGNAILGFNSGISGLFADVNRVPSMLPILTMFITGFINLAVMLPAVTQLIQARQGQSKRDGKDWYAEGPHSDEMVALNKKFGAMHGLSSLINLATFISAITYGFTLAGRLL